MSQVNAGTYTPKKGDVIFYNTYKDVNGITHHSDNSAKGNHIGIVYSFDRIKKELVIDGNGNKNGKVVKKETEWGNVSIMGFGSN